MTSPRRQSVSGLAVTGLVLAIVGLCTAVLAPVGAILGHVALSQIRRRNLRGTSVAVGAIVVGWSFTVLWLGLIVLSPQGVLDIFQGFGDFFSTLVSS